MSSRWESGLAAHWLLSLWVGIPKAHSSVCTISLALMGAIPLPPAAMLYISQCHYHGHYCGFEGLPAQDPLSMIPVAGSLANYSSSLPTVQPRHLPGQGGQE